MIGVFDSGVGGIASYKELRTLLPRADMIFLADRNGAPYGTKKRNELISLVKKDIERLYSLGCQKILMACCTASTVYGELDQAEKKICIPIIAPAARVAAKYKRVAVIATERTVESRAFENEISKISSHSVFWSKALTELVSLVEGGLRDGCVTEHGKNYLDSVAQEIRAFSPDALILGCTHFSHVENELKARLSTTAIVNPAKEGARMLATLPDASREENGRNIYI